MNRTSSIGTEILAPGDQTHLIRTGLAGNLNIAKGTITVHKRRLNRSSDEENSNLPLNTNPRSRPDAFVTIPEQLISKATIEHLGFNSDKAAEIWNGWINWPPGPRREIDPDDGGLEVSFLDWVKGHAGYSNDVWQDDSAAWLACMQHWGIATELQHAIMDTHFKYIRLTGTCIGWVRDTIKMRYAGLQDIQRASKERQSSNLGGPSGTGASQSSGRSISSQQRSALPGVLIDSCSSTQAIAAQNALGMTVLYKGMDQARTNGLFDSQGKLDDITVLASPPQTDFSRNRSLYYFTTSFEVAKRYAAWAKRRANVESVVVIRIAIRNSVIQSMDSTPKLQRLFWPNPDWKEMVWRCRTRKQLAKELGKYSAATLIIGTIANKPDHYYYNFSSAAQLDEKCVLKVKGPNGQQPAVQFVFSAEDEGEALLTEEVRDTTKTIWEIFSRPKLLEEVRNEVTEQAISGDKETGFRLDVSALKTKYPLILSIFQETQRIRHIHANIRKITKDTLLDRKYLLKAGHYVIMPGQPMHTNKTTWGESADEFDPYRFVPKDSTDRKTVASSSFVAWGAPPHLCPARQFASTEILIVVALLAIRCEIIPTTGKWAKNPTLSTGDMATVYTPKKDTEIEVRSREDWVGQWSLKMGESKTRISLASG
ncbi:hypothetical protein ACHAPU_003183 [Fusarium lateritium]